MTDMESECGSLADYVEFMGKPKKGEVLRYLLAAQVRKRFLEEPPYNWRRLAKGAALTGNPEKLIEIYHLKDPRTFGPGLKELTREPRLPFQEEIEKRLVDNPKDLEMRCYTRVGFRQDPPRSELAMKRYLLHLKLTLESEDKIRRFSELMEGLLKVFAQHGLTLIVSGQQLLKAKKEGQAVPRPRILNIWQFNEAEEVESLMSRLADNTAYAELNHLGEQNQNIYRNVSRHYQNSPLLVRSHPNPRVRARVSP